MTDIVERLRAIEKHGLDAKGRGTAKHAREEIERLRAALRDLRERAVEEGIHHFVKRIDRALEQKP